MQPSNDRETNRFLCWKTGRWSQKQDQLLLSVPIKYQSGGFLLRHPLSRSVSPSLMAFSPTLLTHNSFPCLPQFPQSLRRNHPLHFPSFRSIKAAAEQTDNKEKKPTTQSKTQQDSSNNAQPSSTSTPAPKLPKKPVYSSEFFFY